MDLAWCFYNFLLAIGTALFSLPLLDSLFLTESTQIILSSASFTMQQITMIFSQVTYQSRALQLQYIESPSVLSDTCLCQFLESR